MTDTAHINAIGTAVPDHDIHAAFIGWARGQVSGERDARLFDRMASRSAIAHRWSVLPRGADGGSPVAAGGFYADALPGTTARMRVYAEAAPALALDAVARLREQVALDGITHLVVASCTGFVAPGVDQVIAARLGLAPSVERLLIGFMGCYAAVAALRSARHIVRSDPGSRVLVVTVELSTLHLQDTAELEPLLAMLQFGDGAAAALVSAEANGFALGETFATTLPDSAGLIRWDVTDSGFAMHLSGEVPGRIAAGLADPDFARAATGGHDVAAIDGWAVHAGGRSILDAVEKALRLDPQALDASRAVLAANGNMSSATLMFVLARLLAGPPVRQGVALAFGPGLAAEGFGFARRMSLATRAQGEELMDADDLAAATYAAVVGDLARVNAVTMAARPTLAFLTRATRGTKRLKLLDVGFGDGDMLRRIARWAARRGIDAELVGVDLNPRSELAARAHTPRDVPIRWTTGDYAELAGQGWDCVISSLVAHHMTRAQLVAFLRFMDAESARGWLVNDLHRHGFAHAGFPLLAWAARWHPIVRHDGRLSIARSYRPAEWSPLLAEAGVDARVYRVFPFRLCVERLCCPPKP